LRKIAYLKLSFGTGYRPALIPKTEPIPYFC
jgi:hypothetical protein